MDSENLDLLKIVYGSKVVSSSQLSLLSQLPLNQACQTQTTLRAASALKTYKGATKVLKSSLCGPYFTKIK